MAKVTLEDVSSGFAATTLINANNGVIETAFENTLSRDGTGPNQMEANIDMNGYRILNQANPINVDGFNWEGSWVTATLYAIGDVVENNGSAYVCIEEHTSGTFATDLAAVKWQLVAQASLPSQTGHSGSLLTTDGSTASWQDVPAYVQTLLDDTTAEEARTTLDVYSRAQASQIFPIYADVSGGNMTLYLFPCVISFRDVNEASGTINTRVVTSNISTTIYQGSTAGFTSGVLGRIYIFAMDVGGTVELGWINAIGANDLTEKSLISTSSEGGGVFPGADLTGTPYSTTARSNVPYRMVGYIHSTQAVAGTWATAPSRIQGAGGLALSHLSTFGGMGHQWMIMTASRAYNTTYTNTTGRPILINATMTSSITDIAVIVIDGVVSIYGSAGSSGSFLSVQAIIPSGSTYRARVDIGSGTLQSFIEMR